MRFVWSQELKSIGYSLKQGENQMKKKRNQKVKIPLKSAVTKITFDLKKMSFAQKLLLERLIKKA